MEFDFSSNLIMESFELSSLLRIILILDITSFTVLSVFEGAETVD
jgi:hypothetical protein